MNRLHKSYGVKVRRAASVYEVCLTGHKKHSSRQIKEEDEELKDSFM